MKIGWRIALAFVLVVAVGAIIYVGLKKGSEPEGELYFSQGSSLPMPSGNIDAAVNSFILDSDKEAAAIYGDSYDSAALNYNDAELSNFGQSYENYF